MLNTHIKYYFLYYPFKHFIEDKRGKRKASMGLLWRVRMKKKKSIITYKSGFYQEPVSESKKISALPSPPVSLLLILNWLTMFYCGFILCFYIVRFETTRQRHRILLPLFICLYSLRGLPRKAQHLNAQLFWWIILSL